MIPESKQESGVIAGSHRSQPEVLICAAATPLVEATTMMPASTMITLKHLSPENRHTRIIWPTPLPDSAWAHTSFSIPATVAVIAT
jgi:hypothetical protein